MLKDCRVIMIKWGQMDMAVYDYAKQLADRGYQVATICRWDLDKKTSQANGKLSRYGYSEKKSSQWQFLLFLPWLVRTIKTIMATDQQSRGFIIHCHSSIKFVLPLPLLGKWLFPRERPIWWILDVRTGCILTHGFRKPIWDFLFKLGARQFDDLLFIDEHLADRMRPLIHHKPEFILPLGVYAELFHPDPELRLQGRQLLDLAEGDFVFLYGGVLARVRQLDKILQAFHLVKSSASNGQNLKLVIAGEGPESSRLQELGRWLNLGDAVLFPGAIPYETYPAVVNAADVALATIPMVPQYDSQPPKKTIEYLACGAPVIATGTRGNRRFVSHLENGLIVGDSVAEIAAAMTVLSQDPGLRMALKERALSSIVPYEMKVLGRRLIEIYQRCMQTSSPRYAG